MQRMGATRSPGFGSLLAMLARAPSWLPWSCLLLLAGGCPRNDLGPEADTGGESESTGAPTTGSAGTKYSATIRRTSYGIPHILADDLGSAGFGQAYAFAQDHACVLADQIVKVRSERALFFGPGAQGEHLDSDFGYLALDVMNRAGAGLESQPEDVRALIDGYVAGYNQYIIDTGRDAVPGTCAGQPWVRTISAVDLFAYYIDLGLLASGNALLDYIATAQPPGSPLTLPGGPLTGLRGPKGTGFGSNGWAIGGARSASGGGMVVANPHFPWEGELKLWESHVTVPEQLNVYGVGLMGVPGALIGFNDNIGWTHTFSEGQRFTLYQLQLVEGDPTSYLVDGEARKMEAREHTIRVRQDDGTLADQTRTLYSSHHGPMLNIDPIGWTTTLALTYRDANIDNTTLIRQFFGMNRAGSLADFKKVYEEVSGIPWVNTMAADKGGKTWYIDASATPRLSKEALDAWLLTTEDGLPGLLYNQGLVLLDGSTAANDWTDADGARSPGVVPYSEFPQLDRDDYVFNANDSYWLSNPAEPLEGFSPLHGFERIPQSPRTRMNIRLLSEDGGAAGDDGKFTVEELQAAIMGNESLTADLLLAAIVSRCEDPPEVLVEGEPVDVGPACDVLADWDGLYDVDSVGAVVWREFLGAFNYQTLTNAGVLFTVPFDADDPANTPNTPPEPPLIGEEDKLMTGLGRAVLRLAEAGVPVDAALGDVQRAPHGDTDYAVPGGNSREGIANIVTYGTLKTTLDPLTPRGELVNDATGLTVDGRYVINYGSSFVMALELAKDGPRGQAFLTYSESDDPASPHYADQTVLFSEQQWRPLVFTEADIAADPALKVLEVVGGEP